ncbi:peptidase C45 acyl-coenzyme A:6-aminopenicillanic acid acyl-transferase-like protein [Xylaria bambusicola]|uniref:peptidase C45 acyl-coenzyme A:6-aminopenicillanic acid acyl-transferase-like protein n=1 Tax=Xylaria bambusicola TaxID=326684 RepID=UPI002008029C|nr:peptidase C45 acyl-coenzyme A:6-aminopenicillanic acid acyl-transferase-like protein [Xylaria bambusicola]KAI0515135.1 peptidase C45 acyl-coenzyme A:6-aminopenicillanic acid acyl-transferase-like protein [Xylaria bambusicola]
MLEIKCTGTPYDIGVAHGVYAREKIAGSMEFYTRLFQRSCSLAWPEVLQEAAKYVEPLERIAPRHLEEIRGIAEGAGLTFLDILALNIRSEITFGLFTDVAAGNNSLASVPSDGCTSLGWLTASGPSFLAQNWDWEVEQTPNLLVCHVSQPGTDIPNFSMVTEAGIIGKIGLNAAGVGCCLNAIKCHGVDPSKLPIHFALRKVLESPSRAAAVEAIERLGAAGSGHILVADGTGSTGLECTSKWVKQVTMDEAKRVCHTNHLLSDKSDVNEVPWLADSRPRLARIRELASGVTDPNLDTLAALFKDTEGYPCSINRRQEGESAAQTLFTIVMDLTAKSARVTFGRPTEVYGRVSLSF